MSHKTLIIGIGGTGLSTVRELRRLIAERYDQGLEAPDVSSIRFLYIDTDAGDVEKRSWVVLGKKIHLRPSECVYITGDKLGPIVQTPENHPTIDEWLPRVKDFIGEPGPGAKGIRPYGRLIYEAAENKAKVRKACTDLYNGLDASFPGTEGWRIYLIAGTSGGTGSGMALPLSADLVRWHLHTRGVQNHKFYSFFVLPPLQISDRHARYHQNAYAFLREINYRALRPNDPLPYSNCYLVEPRNANGRSIGLDNLPPMIAHRIFLNIQGGGAAAIADSVMDNTDRHGSVDGGDATRRHATCFSTFGLSSVSYPRETVAQCLAYQQAAALANSWTATRDHPKNVNDHVLADLHSMRLSAEHVWGNADPFGNKDHPSHEVEVNNLVDQHFQSVTKKQLGKAAEKIRQTIEESFRGLGYQGFYQLKDSNLSGARQAALAKVRLRVTSLIKDQAFGVRFTQEYLAHLKKHLFDWRQDAVAKSMAAATDRQNLFRTNLSDSINDIRNNEQKFFYSDRAFEQDRANVGDNLKAYLRLLFNGAAARYAIKLLDLVLQDLVTIEGDLVRWESRVIETADVLQAKLKSVLDSAAQGNQENGTVIFNLQSLSTLTSQISSASVLPALEETVRLRLGQDQLDILLLASSDSAAASTILYDAAYQWVLSSTCPVDVRNISVYSKFVEAYPQEDKRQQILKHTEALSAAFLHFSPEQVNIGGVQPTHVPVTVLPRDPGMMVGKPSDKMTAQSVVLKDLQAIQRQSPNFGDDPERIVFLQETQSFPLRYIELLKELKRIYSEYEPSVALHIDKRETLNLFELFALSAEDRARAELDIRRQHSDEETFLISRVYGWVTSVRNPKSERDEIRIEFTEPGMPGVTSVLLGDSWEEATSAFVSGNQDNGCAKAFAFLRNQARQFRSSIVDNAQLRRDLIARFDQFLGNVAALYDDGVRDPRYERDRAVIARVLRRELESPARHA